MQERKAKGSATLSDLKGIATKVRGASESIGVLRDTVEQIERTITVVRGITTKTDLLALNASIEAARAGQSGKGFAVVAHEVARLAEKSQESIQDIDELFFALKDQIERLANGFDMCRDTLERIEQNSESSLVDSIEYPNAS